MSRPPGPPRCSSLRERALALAVLALCSLGTLVLRASTIRQGLPHAPDLHERVFACQYELLRDPGAARDAGGRAQLDFGYYPQLVARLAAPWPRAERAPPSDLEDALARAGETHVVLRWTVAVLALLAVPATWWIARAALDPLGAVCAAALCAGSVALAAFAVQARPHAAVAGASAAAVACACAWRADPRPWKLALACGACALAVSALENGVFALGALAAAVVLREPADAPSSGGARGARLLAIALALVALVSAPCYPFLFARSGGSDAAELALERGVLTLFGHRIQLERFDGGGFAVLGRALWHTEPWIALLALAGVAALASRGARARVIGRAGASATWLVALAFAVPALLVTGLYDGTLGRFVLPLVPFLCVLAGAFVSALPRPAAYVAAAIAVLAQALLVARVGAVLAAPDTATLAARWIAAHVPREHGAIGVLPGVRLPLARDPEHLAELPPVGDGNTEPWLRAQRALDAPTLARFGLPLATLPLVRDGALAAAPDEPEARIAEPPARFVERRFAGFEGRWIVLEVWDGRRIPLRRPVFEAARAWASTHGELRVRCSPWDDEVETLPNAIEVEPAIERGSWLLRQLRARRLGPVIEVYELRAER